jgi:hypothetical protein
MSNIARAADVLDHTASITKRVAEILLYTTAVVGLACVIGLFVAGFYGIVHNGDDFDYDLGSSRDGGGGDVIVLPHLLG